MWWRGAAGAVVVLGIAVASGGRAQELPPGEPLAYAVFSGAETRLGKQVKVYGNVGSNDTVHIGHKNRVDGLIAAPTIELGRHSKTGVLFCLLVVGGDHPCLPVTSPVVSPGSLGVGLVAPGAENVDVPRRGSRAPLEAGAYKRLTIGRGSALTLLGGDYLFDRISLARKATLTCATACRVAIRRTLRLDSRAVVEGFPGLAPGDVRFDVTARKVKTGVKLGKRTSVGGIVWAPATRVQVGRRAKIAGSVQGAELRIGSRAQIGTEPEPGTE
jgi:hypothetical protein